MRWKKKKNTMMHLFCVTWSYVPTPLSYSLRIRFSILTTIYFRIKLYHTFWHIFVRLRLLMICIFCIIFISEEGTFSWIGSNSNPVYINYFIVLLIEHYINTSTIHHRIIIFMRQESFPQSRASLSRSQQHYSEYFLIYILSQ